MNTHKTAINILLYIGVLNAKELVSAKNRFSFRCIQHNWHNAFYSLIKCKNNFIVELYIFVPFVLCAVQF